MYKHIQARDPSFKLLHPHKYTWIGSVVKDHANEKNKNLL